MNNHFIILLCLIIWQIQPTNAQFVQIPDPNFKDVLINNVKINTNQDGKIQFSEAENYKGTIFASGKGIKDLTGIEAFSSLRGLDCSDNALTKLNLVKNKSLVKLICNKNKLDSLDLSNCSMLGQLDCSFNELTFLRINNCLNLRNLNCVHNKLPVLNVRQNVVLEILCCDQNKLQTLDVSQNIELIWLDCYQNQLSELDISKCLKLENVDHGLPITKVYMAKEVGKIGYRRKCVTKGNTHMMYRY